MYRILRQIPCCIIRNTSQKRNILNKFVDLGSLHTQKVYFLRWFCSEGVSLVQKSGTRFQVQIDSGTNILV